MSKFGFLEVLQKVEQTKRELPKQLANMTQNYFVLSFRKQGIGNEPWKQVKRRMPGTPEFKYARPRSNRTKPILINTGELRRRVANSVVVADWNRIKLLIDLPYAAAQNYGTDKIAARPFVEQTNELTGKQFNMIEKEFDKIWNS